MATPPVRSGNLEPRAALAYHEATKHSAESVGASRHALDWSNQPLPFKIYQELPPIPLVEDFSERDVPALAAISQGRDLPGVERAERLPDLAALSRVLFLSAGITRRRRHAGGELLFRAHPNTGALYHIDLYLVAGALPDLPAGVYHFGPHDFSLRCLREGDYRALLVLASGENPEIARAPVVVASASTYWRNAWKYQARAYRHCFWDAGTLHANLLAAAESEGLEPVVVVGFTDAPVERLLALDARREGALTLVPLGRSARAALPSPALPELQPALQPLSRSERDYPEIRAAHAASALADEREAAEWRVETPPRSEPPPAGALHPLRVPADPDNSRDFLDRVIRRRGSTRAFDRARSLGFDQLSTVLDRATRGVPADFLEPAGATFLDLYLIVHAVDGLAPGAYVYRRGERALELLRAGDFRRAAGRLALGQALAADAAVNVYSLTDLAAVLARFGNRGYRAAQLEGGIAGGRLYLAAYALGFGASGLTFFDDEVTEFFSPHAARKSVLFLAALGYPDRAALGLAP